MFSRVPTVWLQGIEVVTLVGSIKLFLQCNLMRFQGSSNFIYFYFRSPANGVPEGSLHSTLFDLGAPPQCLTSVPGSEPGISEGLGSLFFHFVNLSLVSFRFILAS